MGIFSWKGGYRGRGVRLTTHLHLETRSRMSEAIRLLPHTCIDGVKREDFVNFNLFVDKGDAV
jgi:hypothetical protein